MQRPVGPDSDPWDQSTTNLVLFKRWDSGKKVRKTSQVSAQRARTCADWMRRAPLRHRSLPGWVRGYPQHPALCLKVQSIGV